MLTLFVVPNEKEYAKKVLQLIKRKKVCYVTLNKSCMAVQALLLKEKIPNDAVYFVDCISARIEQPKKAKNCEFVSAPYDFVAISEGITRAISQGYTFVVFDSLSNLLVYGPILPIGADILVRFIARFLPALKEKNGDALFVCRAKDKVNLLIQESLPIFDRIKEVK